VSPDLLWYSIVPRVGPGTRDWWVVDAGGSPSKCSAPVIGNHSSQFEIPALCDLLVIGHNELWGHWNSDRLPGAWGEANDGNGTVVALGPWSGHVTPSPSKVLEVVAAGAPDRVTFAVDLIRAELDAGGDTP
jgi:hypothetical protein